MWNCQNTGASKIFLLSGSINKEVKNFLWESTLSSLPRSPKRIGSRVQAPVGGSKGRSRRKLLYVLAIFEGPKAVFWGPITFLQDFFLSFPYLFLLSVIFIWEQCSWAFVDFEALPNTLENFLKSMKLWEPTTIVSVHFLRTVWV